MYTVFPEIPFLKGCSWKTEGRCEWRAAPSLKNSQAGLATNAFDQVGCQANDAHFGTQANSCVYPHLIASPLHIFIEVQLGWLQSFGALPLFGGQPHSYPKSFSPAELFSKELGMARLYLQPFFKHFDTRHLKPFRKHLHHYQVQLSRQTSKRIDLSPKLVIKSLHIGY